MNREGEIRFGKTGEEAVREHGLARRRRVSSAGWPNDESAFRASAGDLVRAMRVAVPIRLEAMWTS